MKQKSKPKEIGDVLAYNTLEELNEFMIPRGYAMHPSITIDKALEYMQRYRTEEAQKIMFVKGLVDFIHNLQLDEINNPKKEEK